MHSDFHYDLYDRITDALSANLHFVGQKGALRVLPHSSPSLSHSSLSLLLSLFLSLPPAKSWTHRATKTDRVPSLEDLGCCGEGGQILFSHSPLALSRSDSLFTVPQRLQKERRETKRNLTHRGPLPSCLSTPRPSH